MFDALFVGKIPRENIYLIKINIGSLLGALFNSENLHHLTLIKIRMLKLIIRKANKSALCARPTRGKNQHFKETPACTYSN